MSQPADETRRGRRLLSAVERLIKDTDELIRYVEQVLLDLPQPMRNDEEARLDAASSRIVGRYSNLSALSGGVTALPALLPGGGTLVAMLGGTLADMALMLKLEVEMTLCLTHLYGFDIREPHERQLAFLMASVKTHEAQDEHSALRDLISSQGTAIWNYTPRQVGKALVTVMTRLALASASKSIVKALPVVGVLVGGSMNKVLTARVGRRCAAELARRRKVRMELSARGRGEAPPVETVLDAEFTEG